MKPDQAIKTLAHVPPEGLAEAITLVGLIVGSDREQWVTDEMRRLALEREPMTDLDELETKIEAVFVLARADSERHKRDRCH